MTRVAVAACLLVLVPGCREDAAAPDDGLLIVPDGKADNYYSNAAAEFEVSGTLPVVMTAEELADETLRADRVSRRLTAVGLYLTTLLSDKFRGIDSNGDGEIQESEVFFHNDTYGGFHAMVRNATVEATDVTGDIETGVTATFTIDVAGPHDFISRFTAEEGAAIELQMPAGATIDPANVPRKEIRNFDPATYAGELETVHCAIRPLPVPGNGYPHYADFVADGVYDITLFYGHDYNAARSDLSEARQAWNALEALGYTMPASSFDDLTAASGPATLAVKAGGRDVTIEVRIFHSELFTTDRPAQHALAIAELTSRDVFFYNGHAGPYYGFYLDAAYQASVTYRELASAPFTDRQQLAIAQGCQTYSQYADMLYAHPAKSEDNLDVLTTVNFSYGQGTTELLKNLIRTDAAGNHDPVAFYEIVGDLNSDWINSWKSVFYGVMGLDGDPRMHPYAATDAIGRDCATTADCGDPTGNLCAAESAAGARHCGARALDASACPEGSTWRALASGDVIQGGGCF